MTTFNPPLLYTARVVKLLGHCSLALPLFVSSGCGRAAVGGNTESESGSTESTASSSDASETNSTTQTTTTTTTQTATTGDGDGDGDGDCESLPAPVINQLSGPRGAADLAFDDEGNLVGSNTTSVFKASFEAQAQLWVPGLEGRAATRYLPDGRLAYVQENLARVMLVDPMGSTTVLVANLLYPFGLTVSQEGIVFVADSQRIVRVDPETGDTETWTVDVPEGARWITFDREYEAMYVGGFTSNIWRIPVGPAGEAGVAQPWGTIPMDGTGWGGGESGDVPPGSGGFETGGSASTTGGDPTSGGFIALDIGDGSGEGSAEGGGWEDALIDGLGVDACGNVYVAEFNTSSLYRIGEGGGEGELLIDWPDWQYGHGIEWGSGLGGWSEHSIFLPQPYNEHNVVEVELGVASKARVFP